MQRPITVGSKKTSYCHNYVLHVASYKKLNKDKNFHIRIPIPIRNWPVRDITLYSMYSTVL